MLPNKRYKSEYKILDQLIANNISFAIYRNPSPDSDIHFIFQDSKQAHTLSSYKDVAHQNSFIIAPFSISSETPIISIHADKELVGEENIFKYIREFQFKDVLKSKNLNTNVAEYIEDKEAYKTAFDKFSRQLKEKVVDKLVLSRTLTRKGKISIGLSFYNALEKYTNNYIYLTHSPVSGTWMGCTPEILISKENDIWKTVALAGTKQIDNETSKWDNKNKKEQNIVSIYIENALKASDCPYQKEEIDTINAGNIVHLINRFTFKLPTNAHFSVLLENLHPTPAVCGFPKERSKKFILNNEGHNRKYYSGFIGRSNLNESTNLFVNLRCMEIKQEECILYAGGGILENSEVESEWQETENKLQTILSIIEE